jgi:hypothetical protein
MSAQRLRVAVLLAAVVAGVVLVVIGAVTANDPGPEGVYFNSSGQGFTAYGPVVEDHSGTPWFVAGFVVLGLALAAAAVSWRGQGR